MAKSRVLSAQKLHGGRLLELELLQIEGPDGRTRAREVVRHPGAVAILPLLEREGERKVLLVRQYRVPIDREIWEIPAGTLEPGESPLDCAKRELQEETGYRARSWERLIEYYSTPGFSDERLHLYLARDLEPGESDREEGEFIELGEFSWEELLDDGRLEDAKTLLGLLAAERLLAE